MSATLPDDDPISLFVLQISWIQIILTITLCYAINLLVKYFRRRYHVRDLRRKILHRRAVILSTKRRLKSSLLESKELLDSKESIVSLPVKELLHSLKIGHLHAVDVLRAYQLKALEEDEKTNCVIEFIEEAERWAEVLDKSFLPKGPLHGLPVSIKDNIYVKGYDCTLGLVNFLDKPVEHDAVLIKMLKDLGAIPFVKTNVPQTLMSYSCGNPIFGITVNPWDSTRTPGGSSGGEGALIAGGGSPLGFGTDIGGSGRIPAHFCGIYSLKPTLNRISPKTTRESLEGIQGVHATITPLSRDVDTVVLAMRSLLAYKMFYLDPEVVPIPFNETVFQSKHKLRIGFVMDDGFVTPTPGCQRAVAEAKTALEKAGHQLIPFTIPEPWLAFKLLIRLMSADGNEIIKERWSQDIVDDNFMLHDRILGLPATCRKCLSSLFKVVSPRGAIILSETGISGTRLWNTMAARKRYVALFMSAWKDLQLDILIAPGFSLPAPPFKYPEKLLPNAFTTMLYNLLNFPAGIVPITKESHSDQILLTTYRTDDLIFKWAKQATLGAVGMPIGVQVVGLPWQEELVLRVMTELDKTIKGEKAT